MMDYRDIGAGLSGDQIDRLRHVVPWVRSHHRLRMKDIAAAAGVEVHTLRNFVSGKSRRPADLFLGRLNTFFLSNAKLLPDGYPEANAASSASEGSSIGRRVWPSAIKRLLPLSERDLMRIHDRYSGGYLCFGLSYNPAKIAIAWMSIRRQRDRSRLRGDEITIPRFTVTMRYPDRIDPKVMHRYSVGGLVTSHSGMLFLLGHHGGDLKYMVLREPRAPSFTYLQGVALLTSVNDRQPFAVRALCQYLGRNASRREWQDRIGVYSRDELPHVIDNAEAVKRAIGESGLLKGFDTEQSAALAERAPA